MNLVWFGLDKNAVCFRQTVCETEPNQRASFQEITTESKWKMKLYCAGKNDRFTASLFKAVKSFIASRFII